MPQPVRLAVETTSCRKTGEFEWESLRRLCMSRCVSRYGSDDKRVNKANWDYCHRINPMHKISAAEEAADNVAAEDPDRLQLTY
ncbi:hypothetical protein A2U01_0013441 [Trifolium medium]|uniref:Uncharacterized protein n=1 Tax=Trifolium medium TaxID=97028 RepID=A0A392MYB3_9FABA|nr:hypothetical protein [Trifolium medium]